MNDPVQISVREPSKGSGGHVVAVREVSGRIGSREVVILVHGYNNSRDEALQAYDRFLEKLRRNFPTLTAQVAEFFWPGDEPNKIISTLSYPNQIRPAIDSANELSAYLIGLPKPYLMVVSFVGHSLGCRVIAELLTQWAAAPPANIQLGTVILMAAAVVEKRVDVGERLRPGATLPLKNPVLYSKGDSVLHWTFPLGEAAAGEGFFPVAVGRTGGPGNTWHDAQAMSHQGKSYEHSSYWPGDESSEAVAFALGGAPARTTPVNAVVAGPPRVRNAIRSRSTPIRIPISRPVFA